MNKRVIHIIGTQCAGKSHLLRESGKSSEFQSFCLAEDFYKPNCIMNSSYVMNWTKYNQNINKLPDAVTAFIESADIPVIESSGTNKTLNKVLEGYEVATVAMETPSDDDLKSRCLERNLVLATARKIKREYLKAGHDTLSYDDALKAFADAVKSFKADEGKADASMSIEEILEHRQALRDTDWKSDEFWSMPINGYDPWVGSDDYYFDKKIAIGVIEFWEETFIHSSAEWQGQPFLLEPFQKQIIGHFFAWKCKRAEKNVATGEDVHFRRYGELFIYVPRKNGKTPLAICIALIMYHFDGELAAEVYVMAADKQQAGIAFGDAQYNVENVDAFSEIKVYPSYKSMKYAETMSTMRVMSADGERKHGYRPHCWVVDELHLQKSEELMEVMETGTASRNQPAGITMTTADFDHPSPCNEKLDYALAVMADPTNDPEFFPVVYRADESDDWEDEKTWMKANPNYGVSCKKKYFFKKVRKAKSNPRFLNTFKRLHLNIKTGQTVRWLSPDDWKACADPEFPIEELEGEECTGGIDLASKYDLCSLVLYFPKYKFFLPQFWVPKERIDLFLEYQVWHKAGLLHGTRGRTTDYNFIQDAVVKAAEKYQVTNIGYDPYNASHFVTQLAEYDNVPMLQYNQNMRNFNEPSKEFEKMIMDHELRHNDKSSGLFSWNASNVEVMTDKDGNIRPVKPERSSKAKVDGIIASVMALGIHMNDDLNDFLDPVVSTARQDIEDEEAAALDDENGTHADYTIDEAIDNDDLW